jgi:hypothetical protein
MKHFPIVSHLKSLVKTKEEKYDVKLLNNILNLVTNIFFSYVFGPATIGTLTAQPVFQPGKSRLLDPLDGTLSSIPPPPFEVMRLYNIENISLRKLDKSMDIEKKVNLWEANRKRIYPSNTRHIKQFRPPEKKQKDSQEIETPQSRPLDEVEIDLDVLRLNILFRWL